MAPKSVTATPSKRRREDRGDEPGAAPEAPRAGALRSRHVLAAAPLIAVLLVILVGGYGEHWTWTGYLSTQGQPLTLWDWLEVSLLPLTLALTPVWLRSRTGHPRTWQAAALAAAGVLLVLVVGGYYRDWRWTGFTDNHLWDWVRLFIVPFLLPFAFHVLTAGEERRRGSSGPNSEGAPAAPPRGAVERIAPWLGGSILAVSVLVAAGMLAVGRPAPTAAATTEMLRRAVSVTVDAGDPRWTDTRLEVRPGDRVQVSAFGMVRPSPKAGYRYVSPAGSTPAHRGQQSIATGIPHAALVALIDEHTPHALRQTRPDSVMLIGTQRKMTIRTAGELYLGINDRRTVDNTGWYGADVVLIEHARKAPGRR